jgi:uncharacterized protein (TIGR00730 family)
MSMAKSDIDVKSPDFVEPIEQLIEQVGGEPSNQAGRLVREMMQNALRLVRDDTDLWQIKVMSLALREMRHAFKVFEPYEDVRKISVFGSARTPEEHPQYQAAAQFSRDLSEAGWMVITGAGDGIMRAGHHGAGREASFGVAIRLPFETNANDYILGDEKLVTHRYFFTRKLLFVSQAHAVALFPGGFGTLDEAFEVLTLIQTGKSPLVPVVCVDEPGGDYWKQFHDYVVDQLLKKGMISQPDLSLYHITDDPDEAAAHVMQFYAVYDSMRFVGDDLVIRLRHKLTDAKMAEISRDFADIMDADSLYQAAALEQEEDRLELPRLVVKFDGASYGRLRQMIDAINRS